MIDENEKESMIKILDERINQVDNLSPEFRDFVVDMK